MFLKRKNAKGILIINIPIPIYLMVPSSTGSPQIPLQCMPSSTQRVCVTLHYLYSYSNRALAFIGSCARVPITLQVPGRFLVSHHTHYLV